MNTTTSLFTAVTINGKTRYQPTLTDGRRRYHHPHGNQVAFLDPKGIWNQPTTKHRPVTFRTKWRATLVAEIQEQLRALHVKATYSHTTPDL